MAADFLDEASEHEQEIRDDGINAVRRRMHAHDDVQYEACQWCGDPSEGARYCSAGCTADAEKYARITSPAYQRGQ